MYGPLDDTIEPEAHIVQIFINYSGDASIGEF